VEPEEFEATWEHALAKLSPPEREMIMTVVAGAEVNHSIVYTFVAFGLGLVMGLLL